MAEEKKTSDEVLKIQVGQVFIEGKNYNVTQDAWKKTSKDGNDYYEMRTPIFINKIKKKE